MQNIRVTKQFDFDCAHALDGYEGKCHDIHGHSYHLRITVLGEPIGDEQNSARGMVIDFGDIKRIVKEKILCLFDHRLILRSDSRFKGIEEKNERVRFVEYQPTCENMLADFAERIGKLIPGDVRLESMKLKETPNSYAEWIANDQ